MVSSGLRGFRNPEGFQERGSRCNSVVFVNESSEQVAAFDSAVKGAIIRITPQAAAR